MAWSIGRGRILSNFINSNNLLDIGFKGQNFTWGRREGGKVVLQERIDKGLISDDWIFYWPETTITHLTLLGLDHTPLWLQIDLILKNGKASFKFLSY